MGCYKMMFISLPDFDLSDDINNFNIKITISAENDEGEQTEFVHELYGTLEESEVINE